MAGDGAIVTEREGSGDAGGGWGGWVLGAGNTSRLTPAGSSASLEPVMPCGVLGGINGCARCARGRRQFVCGGLFSLCCRRGSAPRRDVTLNVSRVCKHAGPVCWQRRGGIGCGGRRREQLTVAGHANACVEVGAVVPVSLAVDADADPALDLAARSADRPEASKLEIRMCGATPYALRPSAAAGQGRW